jgi:SNF2 family DNA or RNA helicase
VENNLLELWSIFDFVMPGFLGSNKDFVKDVLRPIQKDNKSGKLKELQEKIDMLILRRLKKTVLTELPDKIETPFYCEMEAEQEKIYQYYLSRAQQDVRKELNEGGFNRSRIKILAILTRLRQVCADPSMFLEDYHGGSAKMDLLEEVLDEALEGGHKILIFSQFTSMLEIIKKKLIEKKIRHLYLHGGTKAKERMDMVDTFSERDTSVFLLSLKAGGTGLNLTAADIVIHFDPWWNPSVENQATDRAYRFGQKNKVQVFQFITKNTIEEKIQALKQRKQELFNALFNNEENAFEMFSEDDIKTLLDVE